ncbi:MAG: hypothetical protein P4L53_09315 [Candidatus Obscuribacterales bacterium]|nr:hypothetical protein [Candidatus Obscuribacterales bacterium]
MQSLKSLIGWLTNSHPLARINRVPVLSFLVLILAFGFIETARYSDHDLIKTIGVDAAPSVVLAQNIKSGVGRMFEDLNTELDAKPGENYDLVKDFDATKVLVAANLTEAAHNITYTDDADHLYPSEPQGELGPVNRLQEGWAQFLMLAAKARVFHENGDAAVLSTARDINTVVNEVLLPSADALSGVNDAHLQDKYASRVHHLIVGLGAAGVGIIFVLFMLYVQGILLTRTFKRGLNPFFAAATGLAFIFFAYCGYAFINANEDLYIAGTAAYPSVKVLTQTRADLLQAKAEASLWLLDRPNADQHQKAFDAYIDKIGKFGRGQTADTINAIATHGYVKGGLGWSATTDGGPLKPDVLSGEIADELNNVTFPGELEGATKTVKVYADFLALDKQVRSLELQGQHAKAITLLAGGNPGQGNYLFDQLIDEKAKNGTLGSTYQINLAQQNAAIQRGFADIDNLEWLTPAILFLIQLLVFGGTLFVRSATSPERAVARWRALSKA